MAELTESEINALFDQALAELRAEGAETGRLLKLSEDNAVAAETACWAARGVTVDPEAVRACYRLAKYTRCIPFAVDFEAGTLTPVNQTSAAESSGVFGLFS